MALSGTVATVGVNDHLVNDSTHMEQEARQAPTRKNSCLKAELQKAQKKIKSQKVVALKCERVTR
jgi:hypothetical protein